MFARPVNEVDVISSSRRAKLHTEAYESLLSLRIGLQRSLDLANKLPVIPKDDFLSSLSSSAQDHPEVESDYSQLNSYINKLEHELFDCLDSQSKKRRKRSSSELSWEEIMSLQQSLEPFWEETLNKWHGRMHFGSEKVKNQLQVFNVRLWDQIQEIAEDEQRSLEKSRLPLQDSERIDVQELKEQTDLSNLSSFGLKLVDHSREATRKRKVFDLEVYDDRSFYSLLLKSFIASHSSQSGGGLDQDMMRSDDLLALKRYRSKKQSSVDRKASKGRKIRYTVHSKLQNFMFPVPMTSQHESFVDSERLFQSLFQ